MEPCCAIQKPNLKPKNGSCPKNRQTGLPYQKKLETILLKVTGQYGYFPSSRLSREGRENQSFNLIKKVFDYVSRA